jgi:glycosyltransferase involved in cell wall biosynthesis
MRLGSGIKNKILQAWAMGRPVVATPESLGGLRAVDESNILVRNEPAAFADTVADLILDPVRAAQLGLAGRATAEREYSWQLRARELDTIFQEVAGTMRKEPKLAESPTAQGKLAKSNSAEGAA